MEGMNTNMNTHLQHLMATASRHPLHQQSNKGQTNLMQEVYYPWECEHVEYQMLSKYDSTIYSARGNKEYHRDIIIIAFHLQM